MFRQMIACPWFPVSVDYWTIFISVLVGITTSFTAWLIVFHVIVPKIRFATKISEIRGVRPRLRSKVCNNGYRDILDCEVIAELRVRGLDPQLPRNIWVLNIPVYAPRFPRLPRSRHRLITFRSYTFDDESAQLLPRGFGSHQDLSLSELFQLNNVIGLRVTIFGYDNFSGSRKAFSHDYTASDIEPRRYMIESLNLAPPSEEAEDDDPGESNQEM
jgi:hypothetical protein